MIRAPLLLVCVAASVAGGPSTSYGCTVVKKIQPEELVANSDLIVVARASEWKHRLKLRQGVDGLEDLEAYLSASATVEVAGYREPTLSIVDQVLGPWTGPNLRLISFEIVEVLFSSTEFPKELHVPADDRRPAAKVRRDAIPYLAARPEADGLCYALDYVLGQTYLLFLQRGRLYHHPMAPVNELVLGPFDPWLLWVRGRVPSATR